MKPRLVQFNANTGYYTMYAWKCSDEFVTAWAWTPVSAYKKWQLYSNLAHQAICEAIYEQLRNE